MSAVLAAAAAASFTLAAHAVPTFAEVKAAHAPSDLTLLDRRGVPIQTLRIDKSVRCLAWVALPDMSPALLQAIVLGEDRHFYEHSGVDWGAVAKSAWGNAWNTRTRGASTLTMQLAGLLDDELARPGGGRSAAQKLGQVITAKRLEANWTKSQILEAYLNRVAWRGEIVGIDALSQTLFGKLPSGLDVQESAVAAALVRGPNAAPALVAQRACGVLQLQKLGCTGVTALAETALVRKGGMPLGEQLAPHFARLFARAAEARQPALRSTLDARIQRVAIDALRRHLAELEGRNVEDGAVIVLDNASGEVLAWVGSSGDLSDAAQVDGVLARRQPGSTLKPFVYELAFEKKLITPATLLDDSPAQIATTSGLYLPQNYDRDFKGWVSARTALGASLNVPAVRTGAMLGADTLFSRLNDFGFALPESGGYYGASLALGSADVTLLALANAYRALANGGMYSPARVPATLVASSTSSTSSTSATSAIPSASRAAAGAGARRSVADGKADAVTAATRAAPRRVADAAATFLVTDILADNTARVRTFGLDSVLATRGFAAVKTGTSKDMRDNWCIGFSDRYTVGVWVGNASGEAMHQVSGVSGAAPVWLALMRRLHEAAPSRRPVPPAGVVAARARFDAAREPERDEWFVAGTQPDAARPGSTTPGASAQRFGISSPRDGSIFALDPDMPPAAQRIAFQGERGTWVLDGKRLGSGETWRWAPWPGRHELRLLAGNGQALQSVRFEVRGAELRDTKAACAAGRTAKRPAALSRAVCKAV